MQPTAAGNWRTVIMKERPGDLAYGLYATRRRRPAAARSAPSAGPSSGIGGTAALPLNAWTHLAATYDGVTLRLYVNGAQVAEQAPPAAIPVSTGAAAHRRQRRLGRVLHRPDRRGPRLQRAP